jgi:hypothetical protein
MSRELGSWMVFFRDGGSLSQYEETSPLFIGDPGTGEVPYRAIDWTRVERLRFESQWARSDFAITPPPAGWQHSLRRRAFRNQRGDEVMCFMLVVSLAGQEVLDATVGHVMYWFPNGVIHDCPQFNCGDAARYGTSILHGVPGSLMPQTHQTDIQAGALLDPVSNPS